MTNIWIILRHRSNLWGLKARANKTPLQSLKNPSTGIEELLAKIRIPCATIQRLLHLFQLFVPGSMQQLPGLIEVSEGILLVRNFRALDAQIGIVRRGLVLGKDNERENPRDNPGRDEKADDGHQSDENFVPGFHGVPLRKGPAAPRRESYNR